MKMTLKYFPLASRINDHSRNDRADEFLREISDELGCEMQEISADELANEELRFIFVMTGGAEGAFLKLYDKICDKPCYILSSRHGNSLAASMEILSYLQQRGRRGEIIHGDGAKAARRIAALIKASDAKKKLEGAKFGVIGAPSDWLIASQPDEETLESKLGAKLVFVPMDELVSEINKKSYSPNRYTDELLHKGYDKDEVEQALYVYGAFRRIVDKYGLHGVTVRCFDLLTSVHTTGCLGLAILNAEGVYGGCEGDIPALISMAVLGDISGKPVFLCNPSRIDTATGDMVLAHCTLPLNMPYEYSLTTHFESGIGVAVAGSIPEGEMTVFKTSADLSRYYVSKGTIVENLREDSLCRSQIRIKLDDYSYFTGSPINNHHLVCTGDECDAVNEFFGLLD